MLEAVHATTDSKASQKLQTDRSLSAIARRRLQYFLWYVRALSQAKKIRRLLSIVERSFAHPWSAGVELKVRFWPGNERGRARFPWGIDTHTMHWDAPVAITVFGKKKGKRKPALCMSIYIEGDVLSIRQLQGMARTDVPNSLCWAETFIDACREFARRECFREVRVPRALSLYSYRYPAVRPDLSPEQRERVVARIRMRMEQRYDRAARSVGFRAAGDWFIWTNPNHRRS